MPRDDQHADLIADLRALGAGRYDLLLPETKAIVSVLQPDEKILGVVYGRYKEMKNNLVARGVLIATDKRVILLNKKFMFKQSDEIVYQVVSAVSYSRMAFVGIVTLSTRMGDVQMRTFNNRAARVFVAAIENMIFPS